MEETSFILQFIYQWSYLGVFGIALIANAFPGIPEEVFILALGYLGSTSNFNMVWIGVVAFLGMFVSDCIIFGLSRGGAKMYHKIAEKIFSKEDVEKMSQSSFAKRHIHKIIFFSRFVVQVRFIGPFLAGLYKVSWKKFLFFDVLALFFYIPTALFLGSYFQGRMEKILSGTAIFGNYLLIFVVVVAIFIIIRAVRKGFIKQLTGNSHARRLKTFFGFSKIDESRFEQDLRDEFPFVYKWKDEAGKKYSDHMHQGKVSFYVTAGEVTLRFADKDILIKRGDYIDIPPQTVHTAIVGPEGCEYLVGQEIENDA